MNILFGVLLIVGSMALGVIFYRIRKSLRYLWADVDGLKKNYYLSQQLFFQERRATWSYLACAIDIKKDPYPFHAQHGEDVWLWQYFKGKENGFFIELGAYNGVSFSNSYFFAKQLGWRGLLIEAIETQYKQCVVNRPESVVVHAALQGDPNKQSETFSVVEGADMLSGIGDKAGMKTMTVPCSTLNTLLEDIKPNHIDFVSIDVEGAELEVLRGFDLDKYKPELVMLEANGLKARQEQESYMKSFGYTRLHTISENDIYQRSDS